MRTRWFWTALFAVAAVFASTSAFPQASLSTAQLNGTVVDTSGRAVAKAQITVRAVETNQSSSSSTNEAGYYVLPSLPPGRYDVTISAPGFAKYQQLGVGLTVGQVATLNITLKVASVGEVITVTTEVPPVETTRTEISQVIDTQQIADLPTVNRRFTDFALLTPGVATSRTGLGSTFTEFEVTQISLAGCVRSATKSLWTEPISSTRSVACSGPRLPGFGPGIPRREQQLRVGIRPGVGRDCERRHQERHQHSARVAV